MHGQGGPDTKVSVLNQSQQKSQMVFKDLSSPLSKSHSKKFGNNIPISHTEPKQNHPKMIPQMHSKQPQQMHLQLTNMHKGGE